MHALDWTICFLPLLLIFVIAAYSKRYVKSVADFMSGNRSAGRYLLAIAGGELQAGAVVFVASFEVISRAGFTLAWWSWLSVPVGIFLSISGFVGFRYRETRAMTLAQFFEIRYSKNFRLLTGVLGFLAGVCRQWEARAEAATALGVRVVKLRLGVVLARDGGALPRLAFPVRIWQGTRLGHGQQGLSWIHIDDLVRLILEAIGNPAYRGPVNATAPMPASNETFTRAVARQLKRPLLPVPGALTRAAVRLLLGQMAQEMLLDGAFVYPRQAERLGFQFRFPGAAEALADLLG